jgi:hypothetical protein
MPVPTETDVTPLVRPVTCTGTGLLVVELFPSSPSSLLPQHWTPPEVVTAQAENAPADTDLTPVASPTTCTGTELSAPTAYPGIVTLSPSSPAPLEPQQSTPPVAVTAQANAFPTDMDVTPLVRLATCTGTGLLVVELFPSSP